MNNFSDVRYALFVVSEEPLNEEVLNEMKRNKSVRHLISEKIEFVRGEGGERIIKQKASNGGNSIIKASGESESTKILNWLRKFILSAAWGNYIPLYRKK